MKIENLISFSDAMIFAMSIPNVIGLYLLSGEVKKDLKNYLEKVKRGEIKEYKQ